MSYYLPISDGVFAPTVHSQGAWSPHEQHMAPASGLLTRALELHEPRPDLQLARISFDILGMIRHEESTIRTRTLRPGRTIELIEATMSSGGRDVIRGTGWRLASSDTSAVAGVEAEPMTPPEQCEPADVMGVWGGGYIHSLEFRPVQPSTPGRGRMWLRTQHDLVQGEPRSALAAFVGLVDTANGIAVRQSPQEWLFPNTDLTIHFHREPRGHWVGLDTRVSWGPTGLGVNETTLHDEHGPVGAALQIITVRAMPDPV